MSRSRIEPEGAAMASHDELKNPNPRGRILEYAEFIEDQVARARSRIKSNDMFRAILWMITVSLGVIFLEVILDHTVELPSMARRLILFGGLGTAAVYADRQADAPEGQYALCREVDRID